MLDTRENYSLKYKISDDFFLYRLDDSLSWIFNVKSGECFNLNQQSYFILSLFDGKKTIGDIYDLYLKKYRENVEESILINDFNDLLRQLQNNNVLIRNK